MRQGHSPSDSLARVQCIRARLKDKANEIDIRLGDPASLPVCLQVREGAKSSEVVHGRTGATATFEVDPRHLNDMVESMSGLRSPIHLPRAERPNGVRLTRDGSVAGRRYPKGTILVVEGVHRVAAAWRLGWRMIPARVFDGTVEDVALLATVSNTKAVRSARSPEDVRNKMLLYRETHGRLPDVQTAMELCRVSRRTVYRVRERFADELDIEPRERETPGARDRTRLTKAHLRRIEATVQAMASEDPEVDCDAAAARIVAALLDTDDFRRERIGAGLRDALDIHLSPDDGSDF